MLKFYYNDKCFKIGVPESQVLSTATWTSVYPNHYFLNKLSYDRINDKIAACTYVTLITTFLVSFRRCYYNGSSPGHMYDGLIL